MQNNNTKYLSVKWATVRGNGSPAPQSQSSPVVVVRKGEWIQEGMEIAQHTQWK